MANAYMWFPVDFVFNFASASVSAGDTVTTGQSSAYYWRANGETSTSPFTLDSESVAEITGIEVFGPFDGSNNRHPIRYIKPVIDNKEPTTIYINHLMAPGYIPGTNEDVLALAGMRYGHAAINIGRPLLFGGDPTEATPKIGPNEGLVMRVSFPSTTEGGSATINTNMVVRVWLAMVKGEEKLQHVLEYQQGPGGTGRYNGQQLDCSFELGDLETGTREVYQNVVGGAGGFRMGDWTMLFGGSDAKKPKIDQFITYGLNRAATTTNQWYQFTLDGSRAYYDWQELMWRHTKRDAVRITHVGVRDASGHLQDVRLYRSDRSVEAIYNMAYSTMPMPADELLWYGPGRLPRAYLVWSSNGSIEIRDDGTSISANNVYVGVYGKRYELE